MAKVGLKDTLALLAKGYSKKDIDELAAIDEAQEAEQKTEEPAKNENQEITQEHLDKMNELMAQLKEKEEQLAQLTQEKDAAEAKVTKLQQDNVHENSAPMAEEAKKAQQDSLNSLVRSYM